MDEISGLLGKPNKELHQITTYESYFSTTMRKMIKGQEERTGTDWKALVFFVLKTIFGLCFPHPHP